MIQLNQETLCADYQSIFKEIRAGPFYTRSYALKEIVAVFMYLKET